MEAAIYRLMAELENKHWWFVSRTHIVNTLIERAHGKQVANKILDLGCGSGNNFEMLSKFGEVTGMEPDSYAINIAAERHKAKTLICDLLPTSNKQLKHEYYDLIVLTDVLEHIENDRQALKNIYELLSKDGGVVFTVPAFPILWGAHDTTHHHFRRYILNDLNNKLLEAGFKIRYISYFNFWLFPVIFSIRIIKKILPFIKDKPDLSTPHPIINSIMKSIFSSEDVFINRIRLPFGVSIIAYVTKI